MIHKKRSCHIEGIHLGYFQVENNDFVRNSRHLVKIGCNNLLMYVHFYSWYSYSSDSGLLWMIQMIYCFGLTDPTITV